MWAVRDGGSSKTVPRKASLVGSALCLLPWPGGGDADHDHDTLGRGRQWNKAQGPPPPYSGVQFPRVENSEFEFGL